VFVTGVGYADITTAASADAKCQAEAAGRLAGTFIAWFPDGTVPAASRFVAGGVEVEGPWFRGDKKRVAASLGGAASAGVGSRAHSSPGFPTARYRPPRGSSPVA